MCSNIQDNSVFLQVSDGIYHTVDERPNQCILEIKEIIEESPKQIKEINRDAKHEIDELKKEIHDIKNAIMELKRNGCSQVANVSDIIPY